MGILDRLFHKSNLKSKQFTGDNGGNALIPIPLGTEFELVDYGFVSSNTSVLIQIVCRKDPYQDFRLLDDDLKKNYPLLSIKKLPKNIVIRSLPLKNGYEGDLYNERNDQAITIRVGPESKENLNLLLEMIKSSKFI